VQERRRGQQFEPREGNATDGLDVGQSLEERNQLLVVNRLGVDGDSFVHGVQVRTGEGAHPKSGRTQESAGEGRRRAFSVGARDVNRGVVALRIGEHRQGVDEGLKRRTSRRFGATSS